MGLTLCLRQEAQALIFLEIWGTNWPLLPAPFVVSCFLCWWFC